MSSSSIKRLLWLLLLPQVLALAENQHLILRIDGISCPFCVATSEKALTALDGVAWVESDLGQGTITLCADVEQAGLDDAKLTALFRDKGFTYRGLREGGAC